MPANVFIFPSAAAVPNSGTDPSQRSHSSIVTSGFCSAYVSRKTSANARDSDLVPRGEAEMCSRVVMGGVPFLVGGFICVRTHIVTRRGTLCQDACTRTFIC